MTTLDLNVDAYIPDSYIPNEYQKLDIYKRIAAIENEEEKDDMAEELTDRFGDIPKKVEKLLEAAGLKALAHSVYVTAVETLQYNPGRYRNCWISSEESCPSRQIRPIHVLSMRGRERTRKIRGWMP